MHMLANMAHHCTQMHPRGAWIQTKSTSCSNNVSHGHCNATIMWCLPTCPYTTHTTSQPWGSVGGWGGCLISVALSLVTAVSAPGGFCTTAMGDPLSTVQPPPPKKKPGHCAVVMEPCLHAGGLWLKPSYTHYSFP